MTLDKMRSLAANTMQHFKPTTTKKCPNCGNTHLGILRSYNLKVCVDCTPFTYIKWELDPGQKPLL